MSSPGDPRSSGKLVRTIAMLSKLDITATGTSHAFRQSGNMRGGDRIVAIPPPMATIPWNVEVPLIGTDLKNIPRPSRGFLLRRPLDGGRDAPMRRRATLSEESDVADSPNFEAMCVCLRNKGVAAIRRLPPVYSGRYRTRRLF